MSLKKTILLFLSIALFLPNLSYAQQEEKTSIRSSVRTNRAYDFYQQGEYQKATKNLDEALRIDPKNEKTRKLKIEICIKQNDIPCADEETKYLLKNNPESAYGYYYQARIYDELDYQKKTFETSFIGFRYPGLSSAEGEFLFNIMLKNAQTPNDIKKIERWMESSLTSKRVKPEFYAMAYERLIEYDLIDDKPRQARLLVGTYYKTIGTPPEEKRIFWADLFSAHNEYNTAYMLIKDLPSEGRVFEMQINSLLSAQRYQEAAKLGEKYIKTVSRPSEDLWYGLANLYDRAGLMESEYYTIYQGIKRTSKNDKLVNRFYIDLLSLRSIWESENNINAKKINEKLNENEVIYLSRMSKAYKKQLGYTNKLIKGGHFSKKEKKMMQKTIALFNNNGDWREYARELLLGKKGSEARAEGIKAAGVGAGAGVQADLEGLLIKKLGRKSLQESTRAKELNNLARVYMKQGNTTEADKALNRAIKKSDEDDADAILGIAQSYADMKNYEKAIEICKKLLKKHPNHINTLTLTAYSYMQLDKEIYAIPYLKKAYNLLPTPERQAKKTHFSQELGHLYSATNQPKTALNYWNIYLEQRKSYEVSMSATVSATMIKNVSLAEEYLNQVNVNNLSTEGQADYWAIKADLLNKQNEKLVAGSAYRVALSIAPTGSLWATYAYNQKAIKDYEEAEYALFRALDYEPNSFTYLTDMTYLQKEMNQWPEARMYAHQALDLPKEDTLEDGKQRYDLKTVLTPMERHFKFYGADGVRLDSGTFAPGTGIIPNASYTGYGGIEGYYMPWLDDSKRKLAVKGRVFWSNYDQSFRKVKDLMAAGLGLRYQPWQKYQFFLSGERIIPIGSQTKEDWLLLANGSLQDGLEYEYIKDDWSFYSLFAQAGYLTEASIPLASATLELGHHFKLFHGRQFAGAIAPMVGSEAVAYDKDTRFDAMVGLVLKTWHWENDIRPHRLHARLAILRRKKLGGNVNDDNTTHLRLELFF